MTYQATLDWLFQQFPAYHKIGAKAYKPSLDNCLTLAKLFGNPEQSLKFVHIAGTNGKGSTSSMLASVLTAAGYKTALFTSPHIVDFRERIRVNGEMISETEVIHFCEQVKALNLEIQPSFFELTWVMALVHFQREKVDVAVIETGLGGRLDATNIIHPLLSLITNIGLEHTNFLGETLEEIAAEKAGIIKENTPVIVSEYLPETKKVFEQKAKMHQSKLIFVADEKSLTTEEYRLPLLGGYQLFNFKAVLAVLIELDGLGFPVTQEKIQKGLDELQQNTGFSGRLQVIQAHPRIIFDVSHNVDGIRSTLDFFKEEIETNHLSVVYGTSSDKDIATIFSLFPTNLNYFFTEFANERSAKMEQLHENAEKLQLKAKFFKNSLSALNEAKLSVNESDTILVFGSFFLISDFF